MVILIHRKLAHYSNFSVEIDYINNALAQIQMGLNGRKNGALRQWLLPPNRRR